MGLAKMKRLQHEQYPTAWVKCCGGAYAISETNSLAKFGKSRSGIKSLYNEFRGELRINKDDCNTIQVLLVGMVSASLQTSLKSWRLKCWF
jgi:hypothetical protein